MVTALNQYDAILLAVAHDFFKALDYASLKTSPDAIVYDTKAFLDRSIGTARFTYSSQKSPEGNQRNQKRNGPQASPFTPKASPQE